MDPIVIAGTERSPAVHFDFKAGVLKISGESYPEDIMGFYKPLHAALDAHLAEVQKSGVACRFEFELLYFNSSSAKAIMVIMDKLEEAAQAGAAVEVIWRYDEEDDNMMELGEELSADLSAAAFRLETLKNDG